MKLYRERTLIHLTPKKRKKKKKKSKYNISIQIKSWQLYKEKGKKKKKHMKSNVMPSFLQGQNAFMIPLSDILRVKLLNFAGNWSRGRNSSKSTAASAAEYKAPQEDDLHNKPLNGFKQSYSVGVAGADNTRFKRIPTMRPTTPTNAINVKEKPASLLRFLCLFSNSWNNSPMNYDKLVFDTV